jgi:hypothetical protein
MDAYLICPETRKSLWLGKPIRSDEKDGTERTRYYHRSSSEGPWNHERELLNMVLWKFLSDHARKDLRVVFSGDFDEDVYEEIGSEDFEMRAYLQGWPEG